MTDPKRLLEAARELAPKTKMKLGAALVVEALSETDGPDRFLTVPEVAERLHLPVYTVRELGRRGELPIIHVGRAVRVSEAALSRYLEANSGVHQGPAETVRARLPGQVGQASVAQLPTQRGRSRRGQRRPRTLGW